MNNIEKHGKHRNMNTHTALHKLIQCIKFMVFHIVKLKNIST